MKPTYQRIAGSFIALPGETRRLYWLDLGGVCLAGSITLLPAAVINLCVHPAPRWISIANVVVSVVIMGASL
jgi:hypothetical protein